MSIKKNTVIVYGREVGLRYNPYAQTKIKSFTKRYEKETGKAANKLDEDENLEFTANMCAILSEGEENYRYFCDRSYKRQPLTAEEFLTLDDETMSALIDLMRAEMKLKPEIEAKEAPPDPKAKKSKKKASGSTGAKVGTGTSGK